MPAKHASVDVQSQFTPLMGSGPVPRRLGSIHSRGRQLEVLHRNDAAGLPVISLELEGLPFSQVSCTKAGVQCGPGEFCAKTFEENAPFREALLDTGLFVDTGRRIDGPHPELEMWRLVA